MAAGRRLSHSDARVRYRYVVLRPDIRDDLNLIHHGATTTGHVVATDRANHGECVYSYLIGVTAYSLSQSQCPDGTRVGVAVTIHYMPTDPTIATMASPRANFASDATGLFIATFHSGAIAFVIALGVLRARARLLS